MTGFSAIDLSKLPAPEAIRSVSFEALLAEMTEEATRRMPDLAPVLALESEPVRQVLRLCAWVRMLDRLEFNDAARGNMLAFATGGDLDALGAFWGVERLVLQERDDRLRPPAPEVLESDDAFRSRVQLSLEGHTTAGPRGAYLFHARSASGDVRDVSVTSPSPGAVRVTVLARQGDGTPSDALLQAVGAALNDEEVRPLTDRVTVRAATVVSYKVTAELTLHYGPDAEVVRNAAQAAVMAHVTAQHRLGHDVTRSGLFAALHRPGVQNVALSAPPADIVIGLGEAAWCRPEDIAISVGGRDV